MSDNYSQIVILVCVEISKALLLALVATSIRFFRKWSNLSTNSQMAFQSTQKISSPSYWYLI